MCITFESLFLNFNSYNKLFILLLSNPHTIFHSLHIIKCKTAEIWCSL